MKPRFTNSGHLRKDFPAWPDHFADPSGRVGKLIDQLRVEAFSALEWVLYPWFFHEPRLTHDVNWMWIPDGVGEVRIGEDQHSIPIRPGDHVFLPAGTLHSEWFPMRRRCHMLSLHFTASVMGGRDFLAVSGFPIHIPGSGPHDPLGQVATRLCQEFAHRSPGWTTAFRAGIEEALMHVLRCHGSRFRTDIALRQTEFRLLPVFEMVEERIGDNSLSIRDLARLLTVSEVRFRSLFRQATGMRPVQFIQHRRIEKARRMLIQTSQSVKEIAILCGYKDPAFFHRVFHKLIGTTPINYRRRLVP